MCHELVECLIAMLNLKQREENVRNTKKKKKKKKKEKKEYGVGQRKEN